MKTIILRYGEINLKGKNRNFFERILKNSIKSKLINFTFKIEYSRNRIFITVDDDLAEEIFNSMLKLPGIENLSLALKVNTELDAIKSEAVRVFDKSTPIFKVETKRVYKKFPMESHEVSKNVGASILEVYDNVDNINVSMKAYKQLIGIEIHEEYTYIYNGIIKGSGGLPIGSSGRGIVLLSGGIDSPVAAIETMKRGVKIDCFHFSTPPYTTEKALHKVNSLVDLLKEYDPDIKLYEINITDMQLDIKEKTTDKYGLLLMRRMMYRITSDYCIKNKYSMIITGESLGQVASQTIESMTLTDKVSEILLIRPLITANKNDIINLAIKHGTYDISIIPFEDACSVFVPKNPVIKPKEKDVIFEEDRFNVEYYINNYVVKEFVKKKKIIENFL